MRTTRESFVNSSLQDDLNALREDIPVTTFVKHVWGYDSADLHWDEWDFEPPMDLENQFFSSTTTEDHYRVFFDLVNHALQQVDDAKVVRTNSPCRVGFQILTSDTAKETGSDLVRRIDESVRMALNDETVRDAYTAAQILSIPLTGEFTRPQGAPFNEKRAGDIGAVDDEMDEGRSTDSFARSLWSQDARNATPGEIRLLNYAANALALAGNRRYVTGVLLQNTKATLWYFDRMGIVRSQAFDLFADPWLTVLTAVAIDSCDAQAVGYQPLLSPSFNETRSSVRGSNLDMSNALNRSGNATTPAGFSFTVTDDALHLQRGLIGRGTVVLPLRPTSGSVQACTSDDLIAKISWPLAYRGREDALIRTIRDRVGSRWKKHVPDLQCSLCLEGESLDLPRFKMGLRERIEDERVFRVLVCARYERLQYAQTLEEFKTIFVDNVRCHRAVFMEAKVLHRDLSVDNLMFHRDSDGDVCGVLNDWDMALDLKTQAPSRKPTDPIGTTPFMALELLTDEPSMHRYRHDLESFVYILIWCTIQLTLDGRLLRPRHPTLADWCHSDWTANGRAKLSALMPFSDEQKALLEAMRAPFRPLVDAWIRPLLRLLRRAHGKRADRAEALALAEAGGIHSEKLLRSESWDEETIGGSFSYEAFMYTIGEEP
ncbi:hypothetical protein EVG20_g9081 [Dentipellis fragilis]|uniref:Fungal-type protein kinase domain-containing protein n=1 Tax=Dentipellis fragilis TaxID=205917 RepID=A0A4Y9Y383_9AGAM|nr:hypothetical protein EVG20_g9081 [Dentipellis fragilis]